MKKGVIFVLFGVTGDLSKRKLIPAIHRLVQKNELKHFHILGVARTAVSPKRLLAQSKKWIPKPNKEILSKIEKNFTFVSADFNREKDYASIKQVVDLLERRDKHDKIFYLATGSHNFAGISNLLVKTKIADQHNCRTKVIYEKPFGRSESSSKKLNKYLRRVFSEDQIYRIDHYLGKELVQAVSMLRFTNRVLEPVWNNKHIQNIQIILDEDFGISERGAYYDTYGAVLDMVQNHALQMLSLVCMEMPQALEGDALRKQKAELLRHVKITDTLVGQYQGYTKEQGIVKNSSTETFAAHKVLINTKRWKGVPMFIRTGKFLHRKETKIIINFKPVKCLFEKNCPTTNNFLEIRMHPHEGIDLTVNSKKPGANQAVPVLLDFCYTCKFGPNTPEGYENLFVDVLESDQTTFTHIDELQAAWKIVDKVKRGKVYTYKKGSQGPKEMDLYFNKKHGVTWR